MASPALTSTEMWERILRFAHSVKRPVTICVAYTADAAAACNILCSLLKNNLVLFNVQPVLFLQELRDSIKKLQDDDDEDECFLLIGLGAVTPLRPLFNPLKHTVLVLDNHRPVHLDNLREERVLVGEEGRELPWLMLWQSSEVQREVSSFFASAARKQSRKRRRKLQRQRRRHAVERRRRTEHEDEALPGKKKSKKSSKRRTEEIDDDDGETNAVDVDAEGADSGSAYTVSSSDDDIDASDIDAEDDANAEEDAESEEDEEDDDDSSGSSNSEGDNDDDEDVPSSSQALTWSTTDTDAALPADTTALYYSAQCCGQSLAVELLELAVSLSRSRDAFLWYASIGVSDLFLRCCIDYASYLLALTRVRDQVVLQTNARQRTTAAAVDGFRAKLQLAEEPQMFLLRHWSLWDAVWHSKWSAGLLRLHHMDSGEEHLKELLARCGISIRVAQQSWTESSAQVRSKAVELVSLELARLEALTPKDAADFSADGSGAGIMDDDRLSDTNAMLSGSGTGRRPQHVIPSVKHPNIVPTITRSSGFGAGVSAFDACHLFRGVLCAPMAPLPPSTSGTPDVLPEALRDLMIAHHRSVFWRAVRTFDLDPNDPQFTDALDAAKQLQSSVVVATSSLMQRGVVLSTRGLHYTLLNDPSRRAGTIDSFWTPLRLEYLAEHVAVALTVERGRRWAMRPLALCCSWPIRDGPHELLQIALAHSGAVNGPNRTLPAVHMWRTVISEVEDDTANVQQEPLLPLSLRVRGREAASHVLESLYLRSAEGNRRELR